MTEIDEQALESFGAWLITLADDTNLLADEAGADETPKTVRICLAGALNYLFKSLDLIDDGIEGLGFLDDAFVLRIACAQAKERGALPESLSHLAEQAGLVRAFLGDLAFRMEKFVSSLESSTVRGRSVESIVNDPAVREELLGDVRGWASRYKAPHFVLDERGLVKLRSFLGAKLPA